MNNEVGERKRRSDKKVDVKPTMSVTLKQQLYDFAELCNEPVKDTAERLVVMGMISPIIIQEFCKWLRRNYTYNSSIAIGYAERPKLKLTSQSETGKVSIRLKINDYDKLSELAYALDITPTATATMLIRLTTRDPEFMQYFINTLNKVNDDQKIKDYVFNVWGVHIK
ncbi:hypothetical protein [Solibacillus daqui]|uniref:hypothetical protein n=1 Tax=Solibacillus daqui TaxID=2912187 RepID=UPI002367198D|nr:hypothetical protein [Solibacillus daqui]